MRERITDFEEVLRVFCILAGFGTSEVPQFVGDRSNAKVWQEIDAFNAVWERVVASRVWRK